METNFSKEDLELIFKALRKQQQQQVIGSRWYEDYDEVLNKIYPLIHHQWLQKGPRLKIDEAFLW